ncbi:MAG: putative sulfate exporter family transporter [Nitrospirae bacterium]|nr:putative sulfate exporter family transporter [Nitrospirota bacterium]
MKHKDHIPGLLVVCVTAFVSVYISTINASFDALVLSIIIGMVLNNLLGGMETFRKGADTAIRIFLPSGIALYGTQLSLAGMRTGLFLSIVIIFIAMFSVTLLLSRVFHLNEKISILLASGVAVCGASAIAIISPLIGSKREDTSISILSVMMLGLLGMIFYPMVYDLFPFTKNEFGFFAGATLPMIGQVKIAAGNVSPDIVSAALQIKLVRVAFLIVLIPLVMIVSNRGERRITVPWFVVAFIVVSFLSNVLRQFDGLFAWGRTFSTFFLSAGLAAIGLSVDFESVVDEGIAPFGVIFVSWLSVVVTIFLFRNIW